MNSALSLDDVPGPETPVEAIARFALTFDWRRQWGSPQKCLAVANSKRHETLSELRTCLLFQQRAWRHAMAEPDAEAQAYWRTLVEMIRAKVRAGELA